MIEYTRVIKHETDRVPGFGAEVMKVPGCEKLASCIQCGTCSGVCPVSIYMDFTPRQIMALTRADFKDDVLRSRTIWLCVSCYACTTECPRQIRITDIIYELKQRAIQSGYYPDKFAVPVLAREFTEMARTNGRITESLLVMRMYLKTNWLAALGMWKLGLKLMSTGRFSYTPEKIEGREQLAKMFGALDKLDTENAQAKTPEPATKGGHS